MSKKPLPESHSDPLCFIGSSTEGLTYAKALAFHLNRAGIRSQQWDISTFGLGKTTIEALEEELARCSFAVFIATADDKTVSRGKAKISPRDNVVFEFGLFAGRLGRERAFLLIPDSGPSIVLPSDLLGVTVGTFTPGAGLKQCRAGMASVADEIIESIQREGPVEAPTDPSLTNELLSSVSWQLSQLASRVTARLRPTQRSQWVQSVLTAALEPFLVRSEDAYAVWLVPGSDGRLDVAASTNLPAGYKHHRWGRAEGLVGRVWDTGSSAAVSKLEKHKWFIPRKGCENNSYVCAAVDGAAGSGGVLAVGSDAGFPINQGDEGLVKAYASILGLIEPGPPRPFEGLTAAAQDALKPLRRFIPTRT